MHQQPAGEHTLLHSPLASTGELPNMAMLKQTNDSYVVLLFVIFLEITILGKKMTSNACQIIVWTLASSVNSDSELSSATTNASSLPCSTVKHAWFIHSLPDSWNIDLQNMVPVNSANTSTFSWMVHHRSTWHSHLVTYSRRVNTTRFNDREDAQRGTNLPWSPVAVDRFFVNLPSLIIVS